MAFSCGLSIYSYASSFRRGELLAEGGQTGNAVYDFFIGRPLNPRIGSLDLKVACELRPGLIGWMLLNLGMVRPPRPPPPPRPILRLQYASTRSYT